MKKINKGIDNAFFSVRNGLAYGEDPEYIRAKGRALRNYLWENLKPLLGDVKEKDYLDQPNIKILNYLKEEIGFPLDGKFEWIENDKSPGNYNLVYFAGENDQNFLDDLISEYIRMFIEEGTLQTNAPEIASDDSEFYDIKRKTGWFERRDLALARRLATIKMTQERDSVSKTNQSLTDISRLDDAYDDGSPGPLPAVEQMTAQEPEIDDHSSQRTVNEPVLNPQEIILGPMKNRVVNEREGYIRHPVAGDGDCGYTAFGIIRTEAFQLLNKNIAAIQHVLMPVIKEWLLDKRFIAYLKTHQLINQNISLDDIQQRLGQYANNLTIIAAFIDFDVRDKQIDGGWAHPATLQALAHLQGIELHIWVLGDNQQLIPHRRDGHYDYSCYQPPNATQRIDLLFVSSNHFERLEFVGNIDELSPIYPLNSTQSLTLFERTEKTDENAEILSQKNEVQKESDESLNRKEEEQTHDADQDASSSSADLVRQSSRLDSPVMDSPQKVDSSAALFARQIQNEDNNKEEKQRRRCSCFPR